MKNLTLFLALMSTAFYVSAQITFNEAIGGPDRDQAISAVATPDGGYAVVGWTLNYGAGDWDIYLTKVDSTGALLWTKTYGGPGQEVDCYVQLTFDNGFLITARTTSFNVQSSDVYLIKANGSGELQWTKTIGGNDWDEGHSVFQTPDSGSVHVGFTKSYGAGNTDVYIIRSDKNGDTKWAKSYGGTGIDYGHIVIAGVDEGYLVVGETESFGAGGRDYYLIKIDTSGTLEWSKTYGGAGDDHGWDVKVTADSCYILAGFTDGYGAGANDVYLIKVNRMGDVIWSRTYGTAANDEGLAIKQTSDGGFIVVGETEPAGSDSADVYLLKTDSYGIPEWARTFGGSGDDGCQSVLQTADGGYFMSGYTNSFGYGNWDFYLIKTDAMGHTASCELASPPVLMSNAAAYTTVSDPPTQTASGGVTTSPASFEGNGGALMVCSSLNTVETITAATGLTIYPAPFTDKISMTMNDRGDQLSTVFFYDVYGKLVEQVSNHFESIQLASVGRGVYFYMASTGQGKIYRGRVVKD